MGGAIYAQSDDENALFFNPAGLNAYRGGNSFMFSIKADGATSFLPAISTLLRGGSRTVAQLAADLEQFQGSPIYGNVAPLSIYFLKKNFSVGLLLADTKVDVALLGRGLDTTVDLTAISDSGLFIGYSRQILPGWVGAANLKGVFRAGGHKTYSVLDIAQNSGISGDLTTLGGAGAGVDIDLGVSYEAPHLIPGVATRFSLAVNNLLASSLSLLRVGNFGPPPALPRMLSLGAVSRIQGTGALQYVDVLLDLSEFALGGISNSDLGARTGSFWKHVNLGAEALFWNWLYARMGLRQGNITLGVGLDARFVKFDFATYAEELAALPGRVSSRRIAFRLAFGFGGARPTVESATAVTVQPETTPAASGGNRVPQETSNPVAPIPAPGGDSQAAPAVEQPHSQNQKSSVENETMVSFRH